MKAIFAGSTDYSYQTIEDVLKDLKESLDIVKSSNFTINKYLEELVRDNFWNSQNIPHNFISYVEYCRKFYQTTEFELSSILLEIKGEVKENHYKRLKSIAENARDINIKIGQLWNKEYEKKDYDNQNFKKVELVYHECRQLAVDLLDVGNMAQRIQDFIGRDNKIFEFKPTIFNGVSIDMKKIFQRKIGFLVIPIVLILFIFLFFFDFGFLNSTIKSYNIHGDSFYITSYKIDQKNSIVIENTFNTEKFTKCSIYNRKNWSCTFPDGSGLHGFKNGQYYNDSDYKYGYLSVPKYRYYILKIINYLQKIVTN